jgi:D-threo-aldose 1-dehydrogenase
MRGSTAFAERRLTIMRTHVVAGDGASQLVARRKLGPSDIIFGAIHIGPSDASQSAGAWGRTATQEEANEAVIAALAAGIVDFDSAPMYSNGCSEARLGKAIAAAGLLGKKARVTTKTGRLVRQLGGVDPVPADDTLTTDPELRELIADYSGDGTRLSFRESLGHLGMGRCFALRVHDCDGAGDPPTDDLSDEVLAADGTLTALRELRQAGDIDEVSLGMNSHVGFHRGPPYILRLLREAPAGTFDTALLAGGWNLLCHEGWEVLCECARRNIAVHVAGVFGGTGQEDNRNIFAPSRKWARAVKQWTGLAAKHGCSLVETAVAFASLPVAVKKIVLGMATPNEVTQNIVAIDAVQRVPAQLWRDAADLRLLPAGLVDGLVEA